MTYRRRLIPLQSLSSSSILPATSSVSIPQLNSLADNRGPTMTHALLPDSPAIDAGVPVELFRDDFESYAVSDPNPADFSPTGNWEHNGVGSTQPRNNVIFLGAEAANTWIAHYDTPGSG